MYSILTLQEILNSDEAVRIPRTGFSCGGLRSNNHRAQQNSVHTLSDDALSSRPGSKYNLPPDEIAKEWTASLQVATALTEEGAAYLGAKSSTTVFVDSVKQVLELHCRKLQEDETMDWESQSYRVWWRVAVPKEAVSKSVTPSSRLPSTGGHKSQVRVVHVVAGEQLM